MILTIDIGNSNTVLVGYHQERIFEERIITAKNNAYAYYKKTFENLECTDIEDIVISCVVPRVEREIIDAVEAVFNLKPIMVQANTIKDFVIHLDKPNEIGADFIATNFGAVGKYKLPAIVADVGSATKLTLAREDASFGGGVIMPGLGTSMQAFREFIPHLPEVELVVPERVVGNSTIDAIQSGALYGLIASIEGVAAKIEKEVGKPCVKILTGGYGVLIKDKIASDFVYDPYLLNDGLFEIYKRGMFIR